MKYKIIVVDNFAREDVSDKLVCDNIDKYYADLICAYLNTRLGGGYSRDFFEVVPQDHKLYEYEP